ncbi:unnamed protein product [Mesocestoides corti]|uniref:Fucosyltransferase n=1 Tax=Mesocestoides corti TaxID=53468 RepID=A0A0R3UBG0_MESCO|nr:unnamed protein product [Mesocestoides corti]
MKFYSRYVIYTAGDLIQSANNHSPVFAPSNRSSSISSALFVEDFISVQKEESQKILEKRHCPSGRLSPYLTILNQYALVNKSEPQIITTEPIPVIYFDTRVLWPKFEKSLPTTCPYRCIYTNRSEEATNASIAVFTRGPTSQMATTFADALWAFDSDESPLRMPSFSIFLTSHPSSTVPKPYGMYWANTQPECVMPANERARMRSHEDARRWLPPDMATKTRLVAWLVSNMYAVNQRKLFVAKLRRWVAVDIYGYRRLACPEPNCLEQLGKRYKFYLAIENSNCRAYITEKLFKNALRHNMVPIVMGGSPDDYFNLAPPNSYIHVDDFASPGHLAAYLRYLDRNDTAYASYFAWKGLGTIRKAPNTFCRLCALYHTTFRRSKPVHLGDFEVHLNPWNLCISPGRWPSDFASNRISFTPFLLVLILLSSCYSFVVSPLNL